MLPLFGHYVAKRNYKAVVLQLPLSPECSSRNLVSILVFENPCIGLSFLFHFILRMQYCCFVAGVDLGVTMTAILPSHHKHASPRSLSRLLY